MNKIIQIAAISGMLAVMFGAFGAHVLKSELSSYMLEVYNKGVHYQFYHTLALLFVGVMMNFNSSKRLIWSANLFIVGIVLFSGSLYLMAITEVKILGVITPIGGSAWIGAWVLLALSASKSVQNK